MLCRLTHPYTVGTCIEIVPRAVHACVYSSSAYEGSPCYIHGTCWKTQELVDCEYHGQWMVSSWIQWKTVDSLNLERSCAPQLTGLYCSHLRRRIRILSRSPGPPSPGRFQAWIGQFGIQSPASMSLNSNEQCCSLWARNSRLGWDRL